MAPPFIRWCKDLLRDLRERRVVRAGIVYGTITVGGLGVLDLIRDLIPWLDRTFPVLVLSAVFAFPVVLMAAWVFELGPDGLRLHRDPGRTSATLGYKLGAGAALALASVVFGWTILSLWERSEAPGGLVGAPPGPDPTHVAVLYFDDHSPGGELDYLANGLTEDLINELVAVEELKVTSRNGVKPYREASPGIEAIARELNVGTLVEGSVTGDRERVRATVQLIDARTDRHLFSGQFETTPGDVLALQDTLASAISRTLRESLGISIRRENERGRTDNAAAWAAYQEARIAYDEGLDIIEAGVRERAVPFLARADSLLARAEQLDADWPDPPVFRGWVAYQRSRARSRTVGYLDPADSTRLLDLAERAVERTDGSAAALELRGVVAWELAEATGAGQAWRSRAEEDLQEAYLQEAGRARTLAYLSWVYRTQGDFRQARFYAQEALQADAFYEEAATVTFRLYEASLELKDLADADRWCARGRSRHPEDIIFVVCRLFLYSLRPEATDPSRAWAILDTLRSESPGQDWELQYRTWSGYQVARVLAGRGMADSARAVLDAYRPGPEDRPWFAYDEAHVELVLGNTEKALELLQLFLSAVPDRAAYLRTDWLFEALWDDPRFIAITSAN